MGNFGDFAENGQELVLSTLEAKAAAPCKALKRRVNRPKNNRSVGLYHYLDRKISGWEHPKSWKFFWFR